MLNDLFKKTKYIALDQSSQMKEEMMSSEASEDGPSVPDGAWIKCDACGSILFHEDVLENKQCCPECGHHFRIGARERLQLLLDEDSFEEWNADMITKNVLQFPGYDEKMQKTMMRTNLNEAVITGIGTVKGAKIVVAVMDSHFFMGSMGQVVGEKITCAIEEATRRELPIVIFTTSGGARMQEGIVSLMQMAKTTTALKRHGNAGLLYISYLTDPTTGGVTASFAMLGDIVLAEPGALIGFAGPRVIEQTINQKLPEGFQRSEFLLKKGFIDQIVPRRKMRTILSRILHLHNRKKHEIVAQYHDGIIDNKRFNNKISAWERVEIARKATRPTALDYIPLLFDCFLEFHGDRYYGDDSAIVGGVAMFAGLPVTVIAHQKGRNTKENITRNFGMPNPEGYRKALRLMKQAEKFHRPIICLVDTPGAYCGLGAEERGQGEAIGRNLFEMSDLKVPILSIIIGEGGSGGALALAVSNEVWMMENSIYSVLSPEGFASILWKDSKKAKEAAEVMKITAKELYDLGIIDRVISEPDGGCDDELLEVTDCMKHHMVEFLNQVMMESEDEIIAKRYEKYRKLY